MTVSVVFTNKEVFVTENKNITKASYADAVEFINKDFASRPHLSGFVGNVVMIKDVATTKKDTIANFTAMGFSVANVQSK